MSNELDDELVRTLQNTFYDESSDLFSTIEQCLLELENRNDEESRTKLMRALHSIKGSAKAVGFKNLSAFAHELENAFLKPSSNKDFGLFFRANDCMISHIELLRKNQEAQANQIIKSFYWNQKP